VDVKTVSESIMIKEIHGERFTPFSLSNKLRAKILLESASFEQGRGRYSFLLIKEAFSVFQREDEIFLQMDGEELSIESQGRDILDVLLSIAEEHRDKQVHFPFPAGGEI